VILARTALTVAVLVSGTAAAVRLEAHKPITSPFTFNEDVFPILRDRCGACHVAGGSAPMSLMTHEAAVPWGESMRMELIAGHMPPWRVDSAAARFRHANALTARELNVLLTWASGGTPVGDPAKAPPDVQVPTGWALGPPDDTLLLPEVALPAGTDSVVHEFTVRTNGAERRLRAIDLQPGTPAVVRSAQILLRAERTPTGGGVQPETMLALWVPGDRPVELDDRVSLPLPAGAEVIVRVRYRKTWQYEREALADRSRIGLYFSDARGGAALEAIRIDAPVMGGRTSQTLDRDLLALGIYPDPQLTAGALSVVAVRPDNTREELIAFRPRAEWARRYWFVAPVALPAGTRIEVVSASEEETSLLLPPGMTAVQSSAPGSGRALVLNVARP
jgi:hypothetical protein